MARCGGVLIMLMVGGWGHEWLERSGCSVGLLLLLLLLLLFMSHERSYYPMYLRPLALFNPQIFYRILTTSVLTRPLNQDTVVPKTQNFQRGKTGKSKKAEATKSDLPKWKTGSVEPPLLSSSSAVSNTRSSHVRPFPANPPQPPRTERRPYVGIFPPTSTESTP